MRTGQPLHGAALPMQCYSWDAVQADAPMAADIANLDAAWWYNWNTHAFTTSPVEFVPMVWSVRDYESTDAILAAGRGSIERAAWLMGPNEPDLPHGPDHDSMTPKAVADKWHLLAATGKRLVSPGVSSVGETWLLEFLMRIYDAGMKVDAVALHGYFRQAEQLGDWLEGIRGRLRMCGFGHLPVWLTEFAFQQDCYAGTPCKLDVVIEQVRQAVAVLDRHVERYAMFATRTCLWSWLWPLCDNAGGLTALGTAYRDLAKPRSYLYLPDIQKLTTRREFLRRIVAAGVRRSRGYGITVN